MMEQISPPLTFSIYKVNWILHGDMHFKNRVTNENNLIFVQRNAIKMYFLKTI